MTANNNFVHFAHSSLHNIQYDINWTSHNSLNKINCNYDNIGLSDRRSNDEYYDTYYDEWYYFMNILLINHNVYTLQGIWQNIMQHILYNIYYA